MTTEGPELRSDRSRAVVDVVLVDGLYYRPVGRPKVQGVVMGELDGRVACITGGTRGIGRAIAEAFVREGANVVITGRSVDKGKQALDEMQAGDAAHFVAGDVKDRARRARPPSTATVERYGRIDILVTNAGGVRRPRAGRRPHRRGDGGRPALELLARFWTMRKALSLHDPAAVRPDHADLVRSRARSASPASPSTSSAKHAINGLTKSAAHEVGTLGITVNALCPGGIETDIMKEDGPDAAESMGLDLPGPARLVRPGVGDQAPQRGRGRGAGRRRCSPPTPAPASPAR